MKKEIVVNFIHENIIFRYGMCRYIIISGRRLFYDEAMKKLCEKFDFK